MTREVNPAIAHILQERYGIEGRISPLSGEHDANYRVESANGSCFLFKVHAERWSLAEVECQAAVLEHIANFDPTIGVPRLIRDRAGRALSPAEIDGKSRWCRLSTWLQGTLWAEAGSLSAQARHSLGAFLGRLDKALVGFSHPGAKRQYGWDLSAAEQHISDIQLVEESDRQRTISKVLRHFVDKIKPRLSQCPDQVIHNDANDRNLLLDEDHNVCGLLDFGDMVHSSRVNEVVVAAAYGSIGTDDPTLTACEIVAGYCGELQLEEQEVELILDLIPTRYAVSMIMAAKQIRDQPGNDYLLVSQDAVWPALKCFLDRDGRLERLRMRSAAGWAAVPSSPKIVQWLQSIERPATAIAAPSTNAEFALLEFDRGLVAEKMAAGATRDEAYRQWVTSELEVAHGKMTISRYGEDRAANLQSDDRDIHLGMDLFAAAGTEVRAPLDAVVEQSGFDPSPFGFGGVLLLRHECGDGTPFWSFYGHLAPDSIEGSQATRSFKAGDIIGKLGRSGENGGWPPHLHLQLWTELLISDIAAMPGLARRSDWEIWQSICPDPNLILGLPANSACIVPRESTWLKAQRTRHLGRVLSLAYAAPLKIVRGRGCYLYDESDNAYLDLVNNVCHVGHCHPRVVEAAHSQMAMLNTNTRYLHDNIVEYARRLTQTLPPELSVCFFVNSGSEANDLALRLARAHTKANDVIVLDHAYHGHLSSLVEISPYKFGGAGGEGKAPHVHVAEMPDLYRGRFRYGDKDAGRKYADSVGEIVKELALAGRVPAAFFCESILGCGGQLVLPEGYLRAAYDHVRKAGCVTVADEVQVGFGRVGTHMWAFETQGVIPDIVTMGKPIGNGHPIGAVVTRPEIAASFVTGMEYFNTFGGNPVSAAIGLAVLDVIRDERLLRNAFRIGEMLRAELTRLADRFPVIGDVRNLGLFLGVEFVKDRDTREPAPDLLKRIVEALKSRNILTSSEGPFHNVLKIKPPLVIGSQEVERFVGELKSSLVALCRP